MGQDPLLLGWMGLHHHKGRGPWISVRTRGGGTGQALQLKRWKSSLWHQCRPLVVALTLTLTCRGFCVMAHSYFHLCRMSYKSCLTIIYALFMHKETHVWFGSMLLYIWKRNNSKCVGFSTFSCTWLYLDGYKFWDYFVIQLYLTHPSSYTDNLCVILNFFVDMKKISFVLHNLMQNSNAKWGIPSTLQGHCCISRSDMLNEKKSW